MQRSQYIHSKNTQCCMIRYTHKMCLRMRGMQLKATFSGLLMFVHLIQNFLILPLPFFLDSSAFFVFSIQVIILFANSACFWPSCVKDNSKHTLMRTLFNISTAKSTHKEELRKNYGRTTELWKNYVSHYVKNYSLYKRKNSS